MISHALYSFHLMHYIWHLIYSVWCHIHYVCYITQWHIYGIKQNMFMLYSLDMATGTGLWRKNHCVPSQPLCLTLHSMYFDIKHIVPMLWKEVYVCHHILYICMTPYALHMTSQPLFMISHYAMTFIYTVFMSSHPVYLSSHPLSLSYYLQFID